MDTPYNYWFPMHSLDGFNIHIMSWAEYNDETGVPPKGFDLPPPIVAAVKWKDYPSFREQSLEDQVGYISDNNCLGRWIPSGSDLAFLQDYWIVDSNVMGPNLGAGYIESALLAMNSLLPRHEPPSFGKGRMLAQLVGFSNMVVVSAAVRQGICYEKSTLLKSILADRFDARIVGFNEFDSGVWKEICSIYPPYKCNADEPKLPAIFFGEAVRLGHADYEGESDPFIANAGQIFSLHPRFPAIDKHYWVEVSVEGQARDLDTTPQEAKGDSSFQFLISYFSRMKAPCATYQVTQDML